jgi:hypothetical protein
MDHHVSRATTAGLRQLGVEVLTAAEDGTAELDDPALLDRADGLGRVLFRRDRYLLEEGARRRADGFPFSGVIYAHQLRVPVGVCINDLELIATVAGLDELRDRVTLLPL